MTPRLMNGMAVVDVRGSLTAGTAGADTLCGVVADLAEAGCAHIVLNLDRMTGLDARGLGELARACSAARAHGRRLTLVAPPPRIRRMLALTRLDTVIEITTASGSPARPAPARRGSSPVRPDTAPLTVLAGAP